MNIADVLIIGGGINGTGIAADAAGRGLSVVLCEQYDLASGTSSASTKIIHGGLRYLAEYDFVLVHKALKEREILWRKAPHLIAPLRFVLPYEKGLRPKWMLRIGMWLYDHLSRRRYLPASEAVKFTRHLYGDELKPQFTDGFVYSDCLTDDARLVIHNALAAEELGAKIRTYEKIIRAESYQGIWQVTTFNSLTQQEHHYQARVLINASGPWVKLCQQSLLPTRHAVEVELVKGSHIVVNQLYPGDHAYMLTHTDGRVILIVPFLQKYTLIGTTDIFYSGDPHDVKITPEEITYLCDVANHFFQKPLTSADVIWGYSGVRPLQGEHKENPSKISREYVLQWDKTENQAPLLHIIGGKITTYRKLSEEVVNSLKAFFPSLRGAWTTDVPLPGGNIPQTNFSAFIAHCTEKYHWLPADVVHRYAQQYGTRIETLLSGKHSIADMGTDFGHGLFQHEVDFLCEEEWARTVDDILWRRTKLGLVFTQDEIEKLKNSI